MERTFAIIKPDAMAAGHADAIIEVIEDHGFDIIAQEERRLSKAEVEEFYAEHKERSFFPEVVAFMLSGPVTLLALEKPNAIKAWRDLMGATDPAQADEGTIRKEFGTSKGNNATHGSDSPASAARELAFFFPSL
jgi:nucleoside-diphosphate kinase